MENKFLIYNTFQKLELQNAWSVFSDFIKSLFSYYLFLILERNLYQLI